MLLEVTDLGVAYGRIQAVRGVSFAVDSGQALALLGPNGAGKTSTVEAIVGFLPKTSGSVRFCGKDITRASAAEIARSGLALVPQWRELFPGFSVEETLEAGMYIGRKRGRTSLDDIYQMFPRLAERRRQLAGTLSGGEQQMLAIGRALATTPAMLLLDEPTAGLAVGIVKDLVRVLKTILANGTPILVIEQSIPLASAVAQDCLILTTGTPAWRGTMAEAEKSDDIHRYYFGEPSAGNRLGEIKGQGS